MEITTMSTLAHRLRPLLTGLVVLVLTAGVAFAGKPTTPADGQAVASVASGKTVPVVNEESQTAVEDQDAEAAEESEAEAEAEADEAGENCATDPQALTTEELAELTHGQIVCWAAHQETPEGYDNHGAWVSEWAKQNHGQETKAARSNAARGLSKKP
jgi:hypothetical protein